MDDELTLIRQSQEGDGNAFAQLILPHREKVFAHLLSLVKDQGIAEDLMQEAMIAAYRHINNFQQKSAFATWFWRIAHNKALSWLRQQKNRPATEFHEELYAAKEVVDENQYRELLAFLPEKQRECYRMYVIEQRPQKEIAELLQIPLGTVRSRIHYARRRFKKLDRKRDEGVRARLFDTPPSPHSQVHENECN